MRNPWLLRQISQALAGDPIYSPTLDERRHALLRYYEIIQGQYTTETGSLGKMKKVASYFTAGIPKGPEVRRAIHHAMSIPTAIDAVNAYFDGLIEEAEGQGVDPFATRHAEIPVISRTP